MYSSPVALKGERNEAFEFVSFVFVSNDRLARARMQTDVVETARAVKARQARHPWIQTLIPPVRTTT
jgi:hypothetical protein